MQKMSLILLFVFILTSCSNQTQKRDVFVWDNVEIIEFPKQTGYVNDYALVLNSQNVKNLEDKLKKYNNQTTKVVR